jgi:hypothetical protein
MVEGWWGRIVHWVLADWEGKLERVKILDPSFLHWRTLSYALSKNIVPDSGDRSDGGSPTWRCSWLSFSARPTSFWCRAIGGPP